MARKNRPADNISTGSTADIAFLLLIFFLVTTTITSDQGLLVQLPPKADQPEHIAKINDRNLFEIIINSADQLLVEGERRSSTVGIEAEVMAFVLNTDNNEQLAESPKQAVVSLKTDRGTSYHQFIALYDQLKGAYYQIYAEQLGITVAQVREPARMPPSLRNRYRLVRQQFPMQISLAEPSGVN